MHKKNNLRLFYQYKNLLIIVSFILLSIMSTFLLVHAHFLGGGSDTYIHWQRIIELKRSINYHHLFPTIALNDFNNGGGSAIMSFYPYLNLLPIVFLSYLIPSDINLIYFSFSFYTFTTLIISYYSSLHINHRIDTSYLFAVMYGLSTFMLSHGFQSMDLGILFASIFLPLIIFGFIDFIKNGHWLILSLGLTLVIFSHVLNSIFIILFLLICLSLNFKLLDKNKIISLFKCLLLTLCTTAIFYIPFLKLIFLNKINNPFLFQLNGTSFSSLITNAFDNNIGDNLGFFSILAAFIIPILFYKYFNKFIKQMYWLSIIIIILCSNIFPWSLFQNSFIKIIQFPWRLYFIPQLLLIYIFSLSITKYLSKGSLKNNIIVGILCLTVLLQLGGQNQIINEYKNNPDATYHMKSDQQLPNYGNYKLSNSKQVNNLSYGFSSGDYYPKQSIVWIDKLRNSQGIYNIDHFINFHSHNDGKFTFTNNKRIHELNAPFVIYNGIHYKTYLDNNEIPLNVNKTKLLTLNNVRKGNHHIKIKIIPGISDIIIRVLFFIGILIYLTFLFMHIRMKYNKNKKIVY